MKKLLLLNLGSTSFKFKLYGLEADGSPGEVCAEGAVEEVGRGPGAWQLACGGVKTTGMALFESHGEAFDFCLERLAEDGCLASMEQLAAVGYKAVHAGPLRETCRVDEAVLEAMEQYAPLAPAHNPVYLALMRSLAQRYPGLLQVACFETGFHATIPECRALYGVPYEWAEKYGIRRYGFHGSSHQYIAWKMARLAPGSGRVISVHLGGSSSLCALLNGKSVANSMGATPQGGLFNNNRVGDFDAFCLPLLAEHLGGLDKAMEALGSQSGLLGLSGVSGDLRQVFAEAEAGNARAGLALEALADNTVGYIGMFAAYLGGLDALAFTGGIGFYSAPFRQMVCRRLGLFGAQLDPQANERPGQEEAFCISAVGSPLSLWAIRTDEEYVLARKVTEFLKDQC